MDNNNQNSDFNSYGKPRINLDERIAKKQVRADKATSSFKGSFRETNKQVASDFGKAIEDELLYEANRDLAEQLAEEQYQAVRRAHSRYIEMVNSANSVLSSKEEKRVRLLTEVEDDVLDTEFEEIELALPERKSIFNDNNLLITGSSTAVELPSEDESKEEIESSKFDFGNPPHH